MSTVKPQSGSPYININKPYININKPYININKPYININKPYINITPVSRVLIEKLIFPHLIKKLSVPAAARSKA